MLVLPWAAWSLNGDWLRVAFYGGALFLAYAISALVAQNYAARFVENVLSVASYLPRPSGAPAHAARQV